MIIDLGMVIEATVYPDNYYKHIDVVTCKLGKLADTIAILKSSTFYVHYGQGTSYPGLRRIDFKDFEYILMNFMRYGITLKRSSDDDTFYINSTTDIYKLYKERTSMSSELKTIDLFDEIRKGNITSPDTIISITVHHIDGKFTGIDLNLSRGPYLYDSTNFEAYELVRTSGGDTYTASRIRKFDEWYEDHDYGYIIRDYDVCIGRIPGPVKLYFRKKYSYTERLDKAEMRYKDLKRRIAEAKATINSIYGKRYYVPVVKQVIFNPPATIVLWTDGTKTVVKTQGDDIFDKEKGFAMAVLKKLYGTNAKGSDYYKYLRKLGVANEHCEDYDSDDTTNDTEGDPF